MGASSRLTMAISRPTSRADLQTGSLHGPEIAAHAFVTEARNLRPGNRRNIAISLQKEDNSSPG
jgi:hypothetical protein